MRNIGWLTALAAVVVVAFGSLADAAERRGHGLSSATPLFAQRAIGNRGPRVRPSRINPGLRGVNRGWRGETARPRPPRVKYPGRGGREVRNPRHPRYPRHPRGRDIPGAVVPGIIGVIGTLPTEPAPAEPGYQPPPPRYQPPPSRPRRPVVRNNLRLPPAPPLPPQRPTAIAGSGVPPTGEQRLVPDEVVIQLAAGTSQQAIAQLAARHQLTRLESQTFQVTGELMFRWRIPDQRSVTAVIIALEADSAVISAQPNYLYTAAEDAASQGSPAEKTAAQQTASVETTGLAQGDPAQYAVGKLSLPAAHRLARGDSVRIGVIDSGIDGGHPELAGTIADSFDALPGEAPHSHGTAIAGTIVARARLLGVAPAARILAARAFGATPVSAEATTFSILKSIDWAAGNGARVLNMSFAGPRDPAIGRLLAAAHKRNVVLIAAAGNAGPNSPPLYPAADPHVIAVAATDSRDRLFDQSNRGDHITLAAPGVDIIAPAPRGAYQITSGTSIAAAYVSGLAALLIERRPGMTPDEVREALQATAVDLGPSGPDPEFGAGLANAYRALQSLQPPQAVDAQTASERR